MKAKKLGNARIILLVFACAGSWLAIAGLVVPDVDVDVELTGTLGEGVKPDGLVNPGETITLAAKVTNLGGGSAAGLEYSTRIDPKTTLIPGTVKISPGAMNDSCSCMGNVGLDVPVAGTSKVDDFPRQRPGVYTRLRYKESSTNFMSDLHEEWFTQREAISQGLGRSELILECLLRPEDSHVAWHDIWPNPHTVPVTEVATLHERYAPYCDWQDSWTDKILRN